MRAAAILAIMAICATSNAKNDAKAIKGKVLDENGSPLEFVTVAIRSLPDSVVVLGSVTDVDGLFDLSSEAASLTADHYFVQLSMIGYKTEDLPLSSFDGTVTIKMSPDTSMLNEAVVSAVLPKTELKGNAVVTNIAGSVLEHSGNALDVLGKVPGMIVKSGNLEVIGRGTPEYYINGRKVTDNSELRNLMSEDIQSFDLAVSKSFFENECLNFRLSWIDIFNSSIYHFMTDYGNCVIQQSNDRYQPCVQLRVSYRFNSAQNKYKGTGAGESAKNRM